MHHSDLAVIFDLDGTLWDSTGCASQIWNRVLAQHPEYHLEMTAGRAASLMGKTMEEIGLMLFPDATAEVRSTIIEEFGLEEVNYLREHGAILYDDLEATLQTLAARHPLYIVSNCQDGYVPAFLHAHKLGKYFRDIEMSGRTGMPKGKNIRLLMERNGIRSAVYVGDTLGDETAAAYAGIPFIHAAYGFGTAQAPLASIGSIAELPGRLCQMNMD